MTTTSSKVLVQAKKLPNTQTTQYTSTGMQTIVDHPVVTNVTDTDATLTVNALAASTGVADSNIITKELTVAAGETVIVPALIGLRLDAGDSLSFLASAADALVLRLDGRLIKK